MPDWRSQLETLRPQFESAATRYPHLQHALLAAEADHIAWLDQESERERRRATLLSHGHCLFPLMPSILKSIRIEHLYTAPKPLDQRYVAGLDEFKQLGTAAARLILKLPRETLQLLSPPDPPDPEAGVADALWLSHQWLTVNREVQLTAREKLESQGKDASHIYLPVDDRPCWPDSHRCHEDLWVLLLHNLGWKLGIENSLVAKRTTSDGTMRIGVLHCEQWSAILKKPLCESDHPVIDLPLAWVRSDLAANVFLCSVWAIDILLNHAPQAPVTTAIDAHNQELSQQAEERDERGYVTAPADETAYTPFTTLVTQFLPDGWTPLSLPKIRKVIVNERSIRKWQKNSRRLNVHHTDFLNYMRVHPSGPPEVPSDGWHDDPDEVERRTAQIRQMKTSQK